MRLLNSLNLIGKTSEFAKVYGIEFYHVLSRGSQYRVESMMLRIARKLNYVAFSASQKQKVSMRAPECIPLTLEPELGLDFGGLHEWAREDVVKVLCFCHPDDTPEIGYSLYPEHWGHGYAYEAASALADWYWRETTRDHFIGLADVRNEKSLKVLRRLGGVYTHTGGNDHGHLCEWYIYRRPSA